MKNSRLRRDESGNSLTEYAMVLALVAVACIAAIGNTGASVRSKFNVDLAGAVYGPRTIMPGEKAQGDDAADDGSLANNDQADNKNDGEEHVAPRPSGGATDEDYK